MAIMEVTTFVEFMQVLRWYFVTHMLVDLFLAIMQVTVSVAIMQLEIFAAHTQVIVSAANRWVAIFVVIMQMEVSVAILQVVFSAVNYAHDCFYCNYAGKSFFYSHISFIISYFFLLAQTSVLKNIFKLQVAFNQGISHISILLTISVIWH